MSETGGAVAFIRRVPPFALWAVLSSVWVLLLRIFWSDSKAFEYFQLPTFLGVTLIAARVLPRRHQTWLPPLIGLAVSLVLVLSWKTLS